MGAAKRLGIAAGAAALILTSACGRDAKQTASAKPAVAATADFTGDAESAYCRAALEWDVVEITPRDGTPKSEEKYWNAYAAFLTHGDDVAPAEIKAALHLYADHVVNTILPVLRKYGFDEKRFMSEATDREKKIFDETPDGEKAFSRILRYEWQVCGNGTPDSATDVTFTGEKDSAYCTAEAKGHEAFGKIADGGFDPSAVKAFFTSKALSDALDAKVRNAPSEIADDVAADANWTRTKQIPALAKYDYDFHKVKLQAPAEDRFAIDMSAVEIRDVERRLNAYNEQVCGL